MDCPVKPGNDRLGVGRRQFAPYSSSTPLVSGSISVAPMSAT
jgi:hypothetical protein